MPTRTTPPGRPRAWSPQAPDRRADYRGANRRRRRTRRKAGSAIRHGPEVTARERNAAHHESSLSTAPAHARSCRRNNPCAPGPERSCRIALVAAECSRGSRCGDRFGSNRTTCLPQSTPPMTIAFSDIHAVIATPAAASPGAALRLHEAGLKRARIQRRELVHPNRLLPRAFQASAHTAAWRGSRRYPVLPTLRSSLAFRPAAASVRRPHPLPLRSWRVSCSPPLARVRGPPPAAQTPTHQLRWPCHRDHERRSVIHVGPFPLGACLINPCQRFTRSPPCFHLRGIPSHARTIRRDTGAGPPPQPHSLAHQFLPLPATTIRVCLVSPSAVHQRPPPQLP